jgi:hypothetical protein
MIPNSTLRHLSASILIFSTLIHHIVAAPHVVYSRQLPILSALQLPGCAFRCLITHVLDDGCAGEADFTCHCKDSKLLQAASVCIEQGCGSVQKDNVAAKVKEQCDNGLGGGGGQLPTESDTSVSTSTTMVSSKPSDGEEAAVPTLSSNENTIGASTTSQSSMAIQTTAVASRPLESAGSTGSTGSTPIFPSPTASGTSLPTGVPVPASPESDTLSPGAKAGIGVTVAVLPVIAAIILAWYLRRLKRRVYAAQNANTEPTVEVETATRGRQHVRTLSNNTNNTYPISPLSPSQPGGMEEDTTVSDIGYGMVMKKRGHVLSILIEHENEDANSIRVREPVPGQREGLAGPIELDGVEVAVSELPTTTTPRNRSVER